MTPPSIQVEFCLVAVFIEYFASVGDRLSEFACLFYVRIITFDACLALLQVSIVVPFI